MQIPDSERLRYRFLTADDTDLFFDLDQDPEVMRFINGGKPSTQEHIIEWYVPRLAAYANKEQGWGLWGSFLRETDEYLGWTLVRPVGFFAETSFPRDERNLEIGWRLFQSAWGHGYATEAADAVMGQLKANDLCDHVTAIAVAENLASVGVMKKLGMTLLREERLKSPLALSLIHI